jgi:glutaredoxin 3
MIADGSTSSSASAVDFAGKVKTIKTEREESELSSSSSTAEAPHKDLESQQVASKKRATVTVLTDLDGYEGTTLEQKVDSLITSHPVVIFTKTWCLFSVDAQTFLTDQIKVSIHSVQVDLHPRGNAILKYVQEKTKHRTVLIIYIKGTFLGGFDDVNQLYASGQLQSEYLNGLTQADQCEEFLTKANIGTQPLFWFPSTVNANVVRLAGCFTCICSLSSAVAGQWFDWGQYLAYALFFDFFLRLLCGSKISPIGRLAAVCTSCWEPKERRGRPKQFAAICGVLLSGMGSLCFCLKEKVEPLNYAGTAFMGSIAIFSAMEGFCDFCVGCAIFKWGMKLGLIKK